MISVAAAGNGFADFGGGLGLAYPAADPNVLAVGAVWDSNRGGPFVFSGGSTDYTTDADRLASFSQRDEGLLLAPGAVLTGAGLGGGTATFQGTSAAAPLVTGAALLVQQLALEELGRFLSVEEFRDLAAESAQTIFDGDDEDASVLSSGLTYGRLHLPALAQAVLSLASVTDSGPPAESEGGSEAPTVDVPVAPLDAATAPTVTGVSISGAAWNGGFVAAVDALDGVTDGAYTLPTGGAQLAPLPWTGLNQLSITFSEDVVVQQGDLSLIGINTPDYTAQITGFAYDAVTSTATWTLSQPLDTDKLLVVLDDTVVDSFGNALDGEWVQGVSVASGDGAAGGDFQYRLDVLPGDTSQSRLVAAEDALTIIGGIISVPGQAGYSVLADLNGNGLIAAEDALAAIGRIVGFLPNGEPVIPRGQRGPAGGGRPGRRYRCAGRRRRDERPRGHRHGDRHQRDHGLHREPGRRQRGGHLGPASR